MPTRPPRAGLEDYRRMRDFRKTSEPEGRRRQATSSADLAFVIQKHDASHLHYDLRLEVAGVMRSWAVPKGPSLDPAVRRLAMQVEDHPIEYNTFEGTIPKGEYGGGTVMLWDRGTWSPDDTKSGETALQAARRGLKAGKLSFTLHGERLRGSFALVRTDTGPKPKWLFFKHRDAEARPGSDITADVLTSVDTGRTMDEIAGDNARVWRSNRGGRNGGEAPSAHSGRGRSPDTAANGDAGTVIAPMRPTPARTPPAQGRWTFELWRGGRRVVAYVTADATRLVDERGSDLTRRHRQLADALSAFAERHGRPFVIEGEVTDDDGAASFHAADLLLDGDTVLLGEAWAKRRRALAKLLHRRRIAGVRRQQTWDDAAAALRRAARDGAPGIFARALDAPYEPGVRSESLVRLPTPAD
jgi:bifunctional non-homologous end joining protein LigD